MKICFFIGARANWSTIKSVVEKFVNDNEFNVSLILGPAALSEKFGSIEPYLSEFNLEIIKCSSSLSDSGTNYGMVESSVSVSSELARILNYKKCDWIFLVGDRYEVMSAAIVAASLNIKIAHIMGGELSGTIDEMFRHAITKLSRLHLVATDNAKKNVEQLGEKPETVHNVGCPRIDWIKESIEKKNLIKERFENRSIFPHVGQNLSKLNAKKYILFMLHPVTTLKNQNILYETTLRILVSLHKNNEKVIVFWPNSDGGTKYISKAIRVFREKYSKENFSFVKNLPTIDFLTLMVNCKVMIGNSSSAIREGDFLGVKAINIGDRQLSRDRGKNILDISYDEAMDDISKYISISNKKLISSGSIYGDGNTSNRILSLFKSFKKNPIQIPEIKEFRILK